jgi:hypothetical protein
MSQFTFIFSTKKIFVEEFFKQLLLILANLAKTWNLNKRSTNFDFINLLKHDSAQTPPKDWTSKLFSNYFVETGREWLS